jgi:hypothetical protein
MPAPSSATAAVFPDWTNLVDNWRDTDAEWLRNRTVSPFADAAARDAVMNPVTKNFGMMSIIQAGSVAGGPDFWNGRRGKASVTPTWPSPLMLRV